MITPKEYQVKILKKSKIAEETYEVKFERPKNLEYKAGQYMIVRVLSKTADGKAPVRALSFSSSPNNKEFLSTCFRYDSDPSDFKKLLIEKETDVIIRCPLGKFFLPEDNSKETTMIATGVGIVPFLSMLRYLTEIKSSQKVKLIYTDKKENRMAYLNELKSIEKENKNVKMITRLKRIDKKFLKENSNLKDSIFYICGRPEVVEDIQVILRDLEVNEERIIMEKY